MKSAWTYISTLRLAGKFLPNTRQASVAMKWLWTISLLDILLFSAGAHCINANLLGHILVIFLPTAFHESIRRVITRVVSLGMITTNVQRNIHIEGLARVTVYTSASISIREYFFFHIRLLLIGIHWFMFFKAATWCVYRGLRVKWKKNLVKTLWEHSNSLPLVKHCYWNHHILRIIVSNWLQQLYIMASSYQDKHKPDKQVVR